MKRIGFVVAILILAVGSAHSQSVVVIDGDTLTINGSRHRLFGIDAPEIAQMCKGTQGEEWACGRVAAERLSMLVAAHAVTCSPQGRDYYGRYLSVCSAAKMNINSLLVRKGFAWAFTRYSRDYEEDEQHARLNKLGVWSANNMRAEVFRDQSWQYARDDAPEGCPIKGSIDRDGQHFYRMPWDTHYDNTKISPNKGERWFCDEAEALEAGWRAVRKW